MNRLAARRARGEEGASLLIALAFLLVFALLVTALLQFSVTSFKASNAIVDRERASYSADAAVNTAVARVKKDASMQMGRDTSLGGSACPPVSFSGADSTTPASSATCTALAQSGAVRPGMDGNPANAILTTSTSDGAITLNGGGKLKTNANVYSDGGITLNSATMDAYDNIVSARGGCTAPGSQWVTVQTQCGIIPATAPQYADGIVPAYPSQIQGIMPVDPKSTCGATFNGKTLSNITVFSPGYYTKPKLLTNTGGCGAGLYWFKPGVYFFNLAARQGATWDIDGIVGGGTPMSSYSGSLPTPGSEATQPVSCDPNQAGVQLVFGGETQIVLKQPTWGGNVSSLELCPDPSDPRHTAIYGARVDGGTAEPQTYTLNPSDVKSSPYVNTNACSAYPNNSAATCLLPQHQPPPAWSDPTTSPIDNLIATGPASLGNGTKDETTIFDGFDWSDNSLNIPIDSQPDFPAGLKIDSISVHARHLEPSDKESAQITVSALSRATGQDRECTTPKKVGVNNGSFVDEVFQCTGPLVGQLTSTKGNGLNAQDFAKSLKATYVVEANNAQTLENSRPALDGLQIVVTFTPNIVQQDGCVTAASCSFIQNEAIGDAGHMGIWGTLYAPDAAIGVSGAPFRFESRTNIVFNLGAIVSSMNLTGLPVNDDKGRFRLGNGSGRTVEVVGTSGNQRARALVRVVDSAAAPGLFAVIRQWSTGK